LINNGVIGVKTGEKQKIKADRNRPTIKIQYPMKNLFYLRKLQTTYILSMIQVIRRLVAQNFVEEFAQNSCINKKH